MSGLPVTSNLDASNTYHLRNPGKPLKAMAEALNDSMEVDVIIAIITDSRCGLERRSIDSEGEYTLNLPLSNSSDILRGKDGYTPLHLAVYSGRADVVKAILERVTTLANGFDVDAVEINGASALLYAAFEGHGTCLELLIAKGADVNKCTNDGHSPVYATAAVGQSACTELLLAEGADVNASNNIGYSPLHIAVDKGQTGCVELLIANGADVNAVVKDGHTSLDFATANGETACRAVLKCNGAN